VCLLVWFYFCGWVGYLVVMTFLFVFAFKCGVVFVLGNRGLCSSKIIGEFCWVLLSSSILSLKCRKEKGEGVLN